MDLYPYNAPIILTDSIYLAYGGMTGSSTSAQRQACYLIAEEMVTEDLSTFLLPTIVTGTYLYNPNGNYILNHGYVTRLINVNLVDVEGNVFFSISGSSSIYATILNNEMGLLAVNSFYSFCNGCYPYKLDVTYEAGLPSGTSYHSNILLALTTMATIMLNELIGYGNESPGDAGVERFRNQQYYEERKFLLRTTFGTSAKAQFVHKLLSKYRKYRQVGL